MHYPNDGRYDAADALTVKYAAINASASGNNTIVAAVTSKKIRVLSYSIVCAGAISIKFQSGAGGSDITGAMPMAANGTITAPYNPKGHFETVAGALLNLNLGAAILVAGHLSYVEAT